MTTSIVSVSETLSKIQVNGVDSFGFSSTGDMTGVKSLSGAPMLHRNDIINGDFRIAQVGTSFPAPGNGGYDLDGWQSYNNTAATFPIAQVAGSTAGRLARQANITAADAVVSVGKYVFETSKIEGYNIEKYVGQTFTVAFRAKVPVSGIHCVSLRNAGSDRSYVKEINFPAANVWQNCSFTVIGGLPTAGTWNYTNGIGIALSFAHLCGSAYQTTAETWNTGEFYGTVNQVNDCATIGNVWAMEKVTLNLGTVAAVSEISVEQELIRCQRYFEVGTSTKLRVVDNGNTCVLIVPFKVSKRAAPTISDSGAGTTSDVGLESFSKYLVGAGTIDTGYFTFKASARL